MSKGGLLEGCGVLNMLAPQCTKFLFDHVSRLWMTFLHPLVIWSQKQKEILRKWEKKNVS